MTPPNTTGAQALSDLMRVIDAYAYDYRTSGKMAASRRAVQYELERVLSSRERAGAVAPASSADTWGDTIKHLVSLDHDDFLAEAKRILNATPSAAPGAAVAAREQETVAWVTPQTGQFSWTPQDERYWKRLVYAAPEQSAAPANSENEGENHTNRKI